MSLNSRLHHIITTRVDARPLAIVRIAVSIAAALKATIAWQDVGRLAESQVVRYPVFAGGGNLPEALFGGIIIVWLAATAAFALGWRTRTAGVVLATAISAYLSLDLQFYSNHTYLLITLVLLLVLADAGAALSLDSRSRGGRTVPLWPILTIRLQISVVYFFAAISKLNLDFVSGSVLLASWQWGGVLGMPLALRRIEVLMPLAILTILMELVLAFGLWSRRLRPSTILIGVGLHAGIVVAMGEKLSLIVFAILCLAPYLLFINTRPASRLVIWDDTCSFCRTWIGWFRRLDWLGVHRFVGSSDSRVLNEVGVTRSEADHALQLIGEDVRSSGFDAVRMILEVLPVSYLWAPVLRIPPTPRIGSAAYRRIAARRHCSIASTEQHAEPRPPPRPLVSSRPYSEAE